MRVKHISDHWLQGGTGLTSFPLEDFENMEKAAELNGDPEIIISSERMAGRGSEYSGGSVHYLGGPLKDEKNEQSQEQTRQHWERCSNFWRVYYKVSGRTDPLDS